MAKVMLVEDDDNLREIYEARLTAEGYDIVTAKNGEDALVVAKEHRPDLIISDVMMPNISGFDMLDILRNTQGLHDAKVIMLTALGQSDDKQRAEKLGADRYLVKSQVTLEDIVSTAEELLGNAPAAPAEQPQPSPSTNVAPTTGTTSTEPVPVQTEAPTIPLAQPEVQNTTPSQPVATPVQEVTEPTVITPEPSAPNTPSAQPLNENMEPNQPTPQPMVQPDTTQPNEQAAPLDSLDSAVTTDSMPLAEPPVQSTEPSSPVISMPEVENITTPPANPSVVSPDPLLTQTPENPVVDESQNLAAQNDPLASASSAISQEAAIDITKAMPSNSQDAALQQQIDNFVATTPITTPAYEPEAQGTVTTPDSPQAQPTVISPDSTTATTPIATDQNTQASPEVSTPPANAEVVTPSPNPQPAVGETEASVAQTPTPEAIAPPPAAFDPDDPSSVSL